MKREMNRKAQEMSITTLLLIVLGIAIVVIIILAATGVFGPIFSGLKLAPSGIATLVKACDTYVSINSKTDFCTFRATTDDGGKTEYLNCLDARVTKDMNPTNLGQITCTSATTGSTPEKDECLSLIKGGIANPIVNNVACPPLDCVNALKGTPAGSCAPKDASNVVIPATATQTKPLSSGVIGIVSGQVCCVAP